MRPQRAMVLAAGLGKRMRPITETMPKPLVPVGGKPLIDRGLDALARDGVAEAVVNVHYLADMLAAHLKGRAAPKITISDERGRLLDSGGGVVNALPLLGKEPFYLVNADTFWIDGTGSNLSRLADHWDPACMDMLLLLATPGQATGHDAGTDFLLGADGRLTRAHNDPNGYIYAGAGILDPKILAGAEATPHSLNLYFNRAIAAGRLFGLPLEGHWITVGTPAAIAPAEALLRQLEKAA